MESPDDVNEGRQGSAEERLTLLAEVLEAFNDVEYPGDNEICELGSYEGDDVKRVLRGKRWQDCDWNVLKELTGPNPIAMCFLEPRGFHYFTPAFVADALRRGIESTGVATFFDPAKLKAAEKAEFEERMKLFSAGQRQVLAKFFSVYSSTDWAKRASDYLRSID